ncbi:MAG: OmpA family protein [Gammaproteobacteria bacterium]|nr:OmpA family protein [Gammaproteobacteria bacterium]
MCVRGDLIRRGCVLSLLSTLAACGSLLSSAPSGKPYEKRVYVGVSGAATQLQPLTTGSAYDLSRSESAGAVATVGVDVGRRTALELTAADLGSASLAPIATAGPAVVSQQLTYNSIAGSVVYYALGVRSQIAQRRGLAGYGRLGVNQTSSSADIALDAQENAQLFAGLGAEYMFGKATSVRAEYVGYNGDATAAQLGLVYRFGSPASRPSQPIQGPLVERPSVDEPIPSVDQPDTVDHADTSAPEMVAQESVQPEITDSPTHSATTIASQDTDAELTAPVAPSPDTELAAVETKPTVDTELMPVPERGPENTQERTQERANQTANLSAPELQQNQIPEEDVAAVIPVPPPTEQKTEDTVAMVTPEVRPEPVVPQPTAPAPAPNESTTLAQKPPQPTVESLAPKAPETPPATPAPVATKFSGVLRGVDFVAGSATLTPSANRVLLQVATLLNREPQVRIEIRTHTDAAMDPSVAMALTRQRAVAVARVLVRAGVNKQRLAARAFGSNAPRADSATPTGRAQNNRVELKQL